MARISRVTIVVGHGRSSSLGHHLCEVARGAVEKLGGECRIQDLLADGFDPVLRLEPGEPYPKRSTASSEPLVVRYQDEVMWAEGLVVVHPVWWFAPPAILKGWVDRVLIDGVALRQPEDSGPPVGALEGRRALVIQTFGANRTVDRVVFRDMAFSFWKRCVMGPIGVSHVRRLSLYGVEQMTPSRIATEERRVIGAIERLIG